jgi:hypothetical protein
MPWHKSSPSCQYFALNAILIPDNVYPRRWNVREIEKVSIKLKVSHNWKWVYCRIYFTNVFSIFVIFPLYKKCLKTNLLQEIDNMIVRTLSKKKSRYCVHIYMLLILSTLFSKQFRIKWIILANKNNKKIIKIQNKIQILW